MLRYWESNMIAKIWSSIIGTLSMSKEEMRRIDREVIIGRYPVNPTPKQAVFDEFRRDMLWNFWFGVDFPKK